jgi:hypothetical protein
MHAEHPDVSLVGRQGRVVVVDPAVELERGAPHDAVVVRGDEDERAIGPTGDVGDVVEVLLPGALTGLDELVVRERGDAPCLGVLVRLRDVDFDRHVEQATGTGAVNLMDGMEPSMRA